MKIADDLLIQRQELKFHIPFCRLLSTLQMINQITNSEPLKRDQYQVQNIYFDTPEAKHFLQKINGEPSRSKYRIRSYSNSKNIFLEKKFLASGIKYKLRSLTNLKKLDNFEFMNYLQKLRDPNELELEVRQLIFSDTLSPSLFIGFNRIAYIYKNELRITIDDELTTYSCRDLINGRNTRHISFGLTKSIILEMKFKYYTSEISEIVSSLYPYKKSISKYVLATKLFHF